jgi:hypothetical protein
VLDEGRVQVLEGLICAVFLRHSPVVSITLGGVAVLLIAGVIVWSRMHRHGGTPTSSPR